MSGFLLWILDKFGANRLIKDKNALLTGGNPYTLVMIGGVQFYLIRKVNVSQPLWDLVCIDRGKFGPIAELRGGRSTIGSITRGGAGAVKNKRIAIETSHLPTWKS